jgi:hypothetical protein
MAKKKDGMTQVEKVFALSCISKKDAQIAIRDGIVSTGYPKTQFRYKIRRSPRIKGVIIQIWIKNVINAPRSIDYANDFLDRIEAYMWTFKILSK